MENFHTVKDGFEMDSAPDGWLRLINTRQINGYQYNLPITLNVAVLITGDFNFNNFEVNVIIEHNRRGLQRISEFHPNFMAFNYLWLFPYIEDGYRVRILHKSDIDRPQYK